MASETPNRMTTSHTAHTADVYDEFSTQASEADRMATAQRIASLKARVERFRLAYETDYQRLKALRETIDQLAPKSAGWPLVSVGVLGIITVFLEYLPARLFTQIFTDDPGIWVMLTFAFTVIPATLAIVLGELLRRFRESEHRTMLDNVYLLAVSLLAVSFLAIGFQLRAAYAVLSGAPGLGDWIVQAIALTAIAAIGMVLTAVSAYYRESAQAFKMRWTVARLSRQLDIDQRFLASSRRDLAHARAALYDDNILGEDS